MIEARKDDTKRQVAETSSTFETAGFFMLRAPVLSLKWYLEEFSSSKPTGQTKDAPGLEVSHAATLGTLEVFAEAVAVASPSLHDALLRLEQEKEQRKMQQVELSVSRYFSRMTTRPTPFGLFSGVAVGEFKEATGVELGRAHRKRTRPDMGWLLSIIHGLEQRPEVIRQLEVTVNPLVLVRGERATLAYVTQHGLLPADGGRTDSVSVRFTPVVADALSRAEEPVPFMELADFLVKCYPAAGLERAALLLEQLLGQEFLLSSLRPPLNVPSPLDYLIARLASLDAAVEKELGALKGVREATSAYDALPLGKGLEAYGSLKTRMLNLAREDPPMQIDVALDAKRVELHRTVGDEVARAAECLWRLSTDRRGMSHLRSYHMDFLEQYGVDREVPVLELLDEDRGLGAPATYTFPEGRRKFDEARPVDQNERDALLMQLAMGAVNRGETEVELTEELLATMAQDAPDPASAPLSLEVYAQVVASSSSAVDDGDFRLHIGPNPGAPAAGMTFGRFLDVLGPGTHEALRAVQERVSSLRPEAIFAELVYQPRAGRSANVCLAPSWRDYSVVVGTNASEGTHQLHLEDLRIGATLDRFYIRSASLNKEVVITANNMLNPKGAPNVCRLLYELGHEGVRMWEPFSWGAAGGAPMLPRIRHSKTVLAPARWVLDRQLLSRCNELKDDLDQEIALAWWREEWRVPRHVFMTVGDQRVLLDLNHPLHVADLLKEVIGGKRVALHELPGDTEGQWVCGPDGPHVTECVFPLVRSHSSGAQAPLRFTAKPRRPAADEMTRLPGSDWLFAKLYVSRERQEDFIAGTLSAFAEGAVRAGLADRWFYIRYADPDPHLRVRFGGDPAILSARLLPALHHWVKGLYEGGLVGRFSLDAYEREVERYGGPEAIGLAEKLFASDSRATAELVRLLRGREPGLEAAELAALSLIDLLCALGWTFDQQLGWLATTGGKEEFRKEFRERRKKLMALADPENGQATLLGLPSGASIIDAWSTRRASTREYGEALRTLEREDRLWSPPGRIVGSIVHMHCNRLLGIEREAERRAVAFARNTLHSLHQRRASAK